MEAFFDFAILFLLGGLGGLLAGLLGIGGGIVYVLIFSYYLEKIGVPAEYIVPSIIANSMFAILFAGISGSYKQWKNKNFFLKQVLIIGSTAALFSIVCTYIISQGTWYTKEKFSIFFIALLLFIAFRLFMNRKKQENVEAEKPNSLYYMLTGSISGTIAAFSGIGGGVIIVPILTDLVKMPIKKATSISLGVISIMALCTSLFNYTLHADEKSVLVFSLAIPVALGSLVASPFGVQLANKMKPEHIRWILILFLVVVISKMLLF